MLNVAYALGRILLPIVFIVAGVQKLLDVASIAKLLEDSKVPFPADIVPYLGGIPKYEALGYFIGAVELICALMVLVGLKARWGALVLFVHTAATIVFVHHFWDMAGAAAADNQMQALKNLAIMGGLLMVFAYGQMRWSYDHWRSRNKVQDAELRAARAEGRAEGAETAHTTTVVKERADPRG